jgi:pimeloyl-ACP methyl ester carboxylesterase
MTSVPVRIFIHGLESSVQGTKGVFFRERFPDMLLHNFRGDLQDRLRELNRVLSGKSDIIIVGSSFGGLMAALYAMEHEPKVSKLILLAPALNLIHHGQGEPGVISIPTWVYHGTDDDVIPLKEIKPRAKGLFKNLSFNVVDDDHFLHKTFMNLDWEHLLS